jgi:hypothetical protein
MKRKLKPHTRERSPKRSRQSTTRRGVEGTAAEEAEAGTLLLMQPTMSQPSS